MPLNRSWPEDLDPARAGFKTRTITILRRHGYWDDPTRLDALLADEFLACHMPTTSHPPTTQNVEETATSWQPRRLLPRRLAQAVRDAKLRTGRSWRELARLSRVSHPHLVLISQGRRVPSREVAEAIIRALALDDDVAAELFNAAVVREPAAPGRRGRVVRSGP